MTKKTLFYLSLFFIIAVGCNSSKISLNTKSTLFFEFTNSDTTFSLAEIQQLKKLKTLKLSRATKLNIEEILLAIPNPNELEVLLLDSLNLKTIPKSIKRFQNLKHLSLVHNPKLDFKSTFEVLNNIPIEFLNLKGNQIKLLPENIVFLKSLKALKLSYNHLENERNFIVLGKLKNLKELWLDNNNLHKLPKEIEELSQIKRFYIDHNHLEELPKEMSSMKKLIVLHASYNNLKIFPEVFLKTPSLILVHLNNNQITKVPRSFSSAKYSIKGLILNNNPIPKQERIWIENEFSSFFILSFDQKK